ncbi:MAG: hypothetical protein JWO31_1986 [Phycisphaerales bacterium]|nr:hypothetical protein [Phycisphaerales bacterium]
MTQHDATLAALDAQVSCYRRLAKLAEQQHEYVQQGQTEELLRLLMLRQVELDQLAAHERTLAPAKKQWSTYLAGLLPAARTRAETLLAETKALLERITSADKNDVLVLQQRKLNVGRQIGQATTGRVVNRAYAAAAYGGAKPAGLNVRT